MIMENIRFLFSCVYFLTLIWESGSDVGQNTVGKLNGQAVFTCYIRTSESCPTWKFILKRTKEEAVISKNCTVEQRFAESYAVKTIRSTSYLTLSNLTFKQAGVYECSTKGSIYQNLLTVVDPNLTITVNTTGDVAEAEAVAFTCTMKYNGPTEPESTLKPNVYWTDVRGYNVSNARRSSTDYQVSSTVVVIARKEGMPTYVCNVYFHLNAKPTPRNISLWFFYMQSRNTPKNTYNRSSSSIDVAYAPERTRISAVPSLVRKDGHLCLVSELTCSSSSSPPPTYHWMDVTNEARKISAGNQSTLKTAVSNRTYQCVAENFFRGGTHKSVATFTPIHATDTCESLANEDHRATVIVLGSLSAIFITSTVFLMLVIICRKTSRPCLSARETAGNGEGRNRAVNKARKGVTTCQQNYEQVVRDPKLERASEMYEVLAVAKTDHYTMDPTELYSNA